MLESKEEQISEARIMLEGYCLVFDLLFLWCGGNNWVNNETRRINHDWNEELDPFPPVNYVSPNTFTI